jgi:hypothetical protein
MADPITVPSQYGMPEIVPLPDRPDPYATPAARPARWTQADLLRAADWTVEDLHRVKTLTLPTFPASLIRPKKAFILGFGGNGFDEVLDPAVVRAWAEEACARATEMLGLVSHLVR